MGHGGRRKALAGAWRDDRDFAAVVAPLAHDLRWRLRVRRLAFVRTPRPRLRTAGVVLAATGALVASVSVLLFTFADAYATPMRVSVRLFG